MLLLIDLRLLKMTVFHECAERRLRIVIAFETRISVSWLEKIFKCEALSFSSDSKTGTLIDANLLPRF